MRVFKLEEDEYANRIINSLKPKLPKLFRFKTQKLGEKFANLMWDYMPQDYEILSHWSRDNTEYNVILMYRDFIKNREEEKNSVGSKS